MSPKDIIRGTDFVGPKGADMIIAALDRAGYAIVPKEPTLAMLDAGADRWVTHHPDVDEGHPNERATWRAMIAAVGTS